MDYISKVPGSILENILCLLPIQEAARTSVLSKKWRYIWTNIPKLVFDENTFHASVDGDYLSLSKQDQESQRKRMNSCKLLFAISRVLFTHNGRIHEFTLSMKACKGYTGIDVILHHLSREKTVKILTLKCSPGYKLPSSFFSLDQLTDLYLSGCEIDVKPTLSGFGRLTSLFLEKLFICEDTLLDFLSMSPLLKTVTIHLDVEEITRTGYGTFTEVFECFPVIENLTLWYDFLKCYASYNELPQKLPTAVLHLKYFCVERMCFTEDSYVHILVPVITKSPNLEKLKVEIKHGCCDNNPRGWFTHKDYADIRFEHLRELDIINVKKTAELEFVKLILAKSPVLKKVRIFPYSVLHIRHISKIVLDFPRASSVVEVTVERRRR